MSDILRCGHICGGLPCLREDGTAAADRTTFEIAAESRVMTEAALLCGCLERQIRLRRNPPLRFPQPKLPKRDIGRNATLVEKAASQGSQAYPEPLGQISFAEPDRQGSEHQFFDLADKQHGRQGIAVDPLAACDRIRILPGLTCLRALASQILKPGSVIDVTGLWP
jgi:hypothetical protein